MKLAKVLYHLVEFFNFFLITKKLCYYLKNSKNIKAKLKESFLSSTVCVQIYFFFVFRLVDSYKN